MHCEQSRVGPQGRDMTPREAPPRRQVPTDKVAIDHTFHVGGIPERHATERALINLFTPFGDVKSVVVRRAAPRGGPLCLRASIYRPPCAVDGRGRSPPCVASHFSGAPQERGEQVLGPGVLRQHVHRGGHGGHAGTANHRAGVCAAWLAAIHAPACCRG